MNLADFDYPLPERLIAQRPPAERDAARMLVLDPAKGDLQHARIRDLPGYLDPTDLLVLNDTRVLPARLRGVRSGGAAAEVLLLRPAGEGQDAWEALVRPGRSLRSGAVVHVPGSPLEVAIDGEAGPGVRRVRLRGSADVMGEVQRVGEMPTPPYIKERLRDPARYQTIFARRPGSAAAPTAGLHFTPDLLSAIRGRGTVIAFVTLHVGLDTFRPVRVADPQNHAMHREAFELPAATANAVMEARRRGGRVVAVGTTTVRVLESCAVDAFVRPRQGWTDLYILPGYQFKVVDALLTNFHLPKSTLLMLVSAFAGRERVLAAYAEAAGREYRFYSFGDCMFIPRRA